MLPHAEHMDAVEECS